MNGAVDEAPYPQAARVVVTRGLASCLFLALLLVSLPGRAETLQAPIGAKSIWLGSARVGCSAPGGGWLLDASGHYLRPPVLVDAIGKAVVLKIASEAARLARAHCSSGSSACFAATVK